MVKLDDVSAQMVDEFLLEFMVNVVARAEAGEPTAPESGPALLRLMRESELFHGYILGQVEAMRSKLVTPDQVIRGSIGVGYMLALYAEEKRNRL